MSQKVSAFLAMKGHSERVPNKNIRDFSGKPLYYYIVKSLSDSKYIDDIIIDTDSEKIADSVRELFPEVKVVMRAEHLLGDMVGMSPLIEHSLYKMNHKHVLQTHSTNPLLKTETIDNAIEEYFNVLDRNDSLFSVTRVQSRFYDAHGKAINHDPDILLRTQDLPPIYEENSCLYVFSKDSFYNNNENRLGQKPHLFPIDPLEAVDIDEEVDFKYAKFLYEAGI